MLTVILILLLLVVALPLFLLLGLYIASRKPQHSIIRAHPYMGWLRYLFEKMGPEFRQYWFDEDTTGKPFSRYDYLGVVFAAKYRNEILSFGSKRDFDASGFYLANALFPKLDGELHVNNQEEAPGKKYEIEREGLFLRREHLADDRAARWLFTEEEAIVVGGDRAHPWRLFGPFGASATSYGSVGEHYIKAVGEGSRMAGGSWINTGEGGVAPEHLQTGADVVAQIGPGLFGYRHPDGTFSEAAFQEKAAEPAIRAFELKFAQGAKIRGGHLDGAKVNEKVAGIRDVPPYKTVNSPNRFPFLTTPEETLDFVRRLQELGGKPVGIKLVVGDERSLWPLFQAMDQRNIFPDFFTIDGSEGGSGATYKSMADGMGLPLYPALMTFVDTALRLGVRDRFRIFASGKLISPDKVALALAMGADAVNSARGFMLAGGCIMALQCHTGKCPAGVTTTNPRYMAALVPEEKMWRVMNYILLMRQSLFSLAAACGVPSPRHFSRAHVVYKDGRGNVTPLASEVSVSRSL